MSMDAEFLARLERTRERVVQALLDERASNGVWAGELSSSALSTATAVIAMRLAVARGCAEDGDEQRVARGLAWLVAHANADGGFGDTAESPSNISTSTLAWVALREAGAGCDAAHAGAEAYLTAALGELTPKRLAYEIAEAYDVDQTFSVPILTACALGGAFGEGPDAWRSIPALPFELAALPQRWFHRLGLPVVSYALPALIAIGQTLHHHRPSKNPLARWPRMAARKRTLAVLERIQPTTGGFLEATPLTSFVAMSLIGMGHGAHRVTRECLRFVRASMRAEGSWPIDTNLTTWLTSLSVDALAANDRDDVHGLVAAARERVLPWLAGQQLRAVHPYTGAAPGGWAWTDLSGGVPDADDTPAALLALRRLGSDDVAGAADGVRWLLDLQNRDGGIPTFCRGWSKLPFDKSSPDLTAHTLRAWHAWESELEPGLQRRIDRGRERAVRFLLKEQCLDGPWIPLWFGNQHEPSLENPLYGTSRVLKAAAAAVGTSRDEAWEKALGEAVAWTLGAQAADGGWGGAPGLSPSIEETALALDGLASHALVYGADERLRGALTRGAEWLAEATDEGTRFPASPIGLYFAKLWYSERLYPHVFTAAALGRVGTALATASTPATPRGEGSMNQPEARRLLALKLEEWRRHTYAELAALVDGEPVTGDLSGQDGVRYQFEIQVFWDRRPGGDVRVNAAIDDGGLRAFVPLCDGFILAPDGSFVEE